MVTGDMLIIVNIGLYYLLTLTLVNVVIFQSFKKNHCSYI